MLCQLDLARWAHEKWTTEEQKRKGNYIREQLGSYTFCSHEWLTFSPVVGKPIMSNNHSIVKPVLCQHHKCCTAHQLCSAICWKSPHHAIITCSSPCKSNRLHCGCFSIKSIHCYWLTSQPPFLLLSSSLLFMQTMLHLQCYVSITFSYTMGIKVI